MKKEVYVAYSHSGKEYKKDMSRILKTKDKFKFACMMISDNNAEGYVKNIDGKIYFIGKGTRTAKLITEDNYKLINETFFINI